MGAKVNRFTFGTFLPIPGERGARRLWLCDPESSVKQSAGDASGVDRIGARSVQGARSETGMVTSLVAEWVVLGAVLGVLEEEQQADLPVYRVPSIVPGEWLEG